MKPFWIISLIVIGVLLIIMGVLYFIGRKAQKKRAEQEKVLESSAQVVTMLVIDKKKVRLKDAGLPQIVLDSTPKYLRRSKAPIVKAKIGPKIVSLIADPEIFDNIPVKKEIKAVVSGLYITGLKGYHGKLDQPTKKPSLYTRIRKKISK